MLFSRGKLATRTGRDGAVTDFLIGALDINEIVAARYQSDLSPEVRAIAEAYAAGANFWCAQKKKNCSAGVAPVSAQDVVAGFVSRTPFFYGLDEHLKVLFEGNAEQQAGIESARIAVLNADSQTPTGSNAMAVTGNRSADGATRLFINSHQPFEGPVAWYEARVKSDEGWDMIGGLFPGSPIIPHGVGPNIGWAHTVNKPDIVDVFELTVDDKKSPTQYMFDGSWKDLRIKPVKFRVKLWGPLSLPVTRKAYFSQHGPAFVTDDGVFAVVYAGAQDIRAIEQWYQMGRATNFTQWYDAMRINGIPSFNVVYGDRDGNIGYFYNAKLPKRSADIDWSRPAPGDRSDILWTTYHGFDAVPQVINPASGYVVNANHTPYAASGDGDNPKRADFPPHMGISDTTTNRGRRLQELYGTDPSITRGEFLSYKMDNKYAHASRVMQLVRSLVDDAALLGTPEQQLLSEWDGSVTIDNRAAALAIFTAQRARGYLLNDQDIVEVDAIAALQSVAAELRDGFGRIDPTWGEVVRLTRGAHDLPVNGGPDTLRAIYAVGDLDQGAVRAIAGDTHIIYADWPAAGAGAYPEIKIIHQYGAATLDKTSPHYADQAPLFAAEQYRTPAMTLDGVLAEATRDYRPTQID